MTQPKIDGVGHGVPRMLYASDGSNWYAILVDSDGHVKVDIISAALPTDAATETTLALIKGYVDNLETLLAGGLPAALDTLALKVKEQSPLTGFATSANQATMITALQLIDDLRAALGSVATDKLLVASKSGDKIFGFESIVEEEKSSTNLSAGTFTLSGTAVSAGKVWKITQLCIKYVGTVTNVRLTAQAIGLAGNIRLLDQMTVTSDQWYMWSGEVYMEEGDYLRLAILSATAGDDAYIEYAGVQMNAP